MEKKQALEMIAAISNANGVSGFEDETVEVIKSYAQKVGDTTADRMRNLFVRRNENTGDKPIVQLDAHSDEVGFMVHAVCPNGTLKIIPIGGMVASNIPAHLVRVRNRHGEYITGVTVSKPPHFMTQAERNAPLEMSSISVDVGASSADEAIHDYGIRIGEPVVPDVSFMYNEEKDLMIGKAFDCRAGCSAVLKTLYELQGESLDVDIIGAFAAQEEVGLRGAVVTSNTVKPDIAIVFEGTPADDTVVEKYMVQTAIKHGPMLRHIDAKMITNPRYLRYALDLAEELDIPVQDAVRTGGATNGASIHLSNTGVPVIVIGIPVRYIHTHYGIAAYSDFDNAVKLACALLKRFNRDLIYSF